MNPETYHFVQTRLIARIQLNAQFRLQQADNLFESFAKLSNYHSRMDLLMQKRFGNQQHLAGQNNHRRCAIADLFVLGARNFDHTLGGRMLYGDLTQNGIAIVGHHNAAHRVHQHFQHGLRSEACADNIGDGLHNLMDADKPFENTLELANKWHQLVCRHNRKAECIKHSNFQKAHTI